MPRQSVIDDVDVDEGQGPPILFKNQEIRRMLKLAGTGTEDVFYDLGAGWGQNLIIALTEFGVKKAVGIEKDSQRFSKAEERLKRWSRLNKSIALRGRMVLGDFEKLFDRGLEGADLSEATLVFYGLSTYRELTDGLRKELKPGTRLVYYDHVLFPEFLVDAQDFPFFMSKTPFRRPTSEREWLSSVVLKPQSALRMGSKPDTDELWQELSHDYDVAGFRDEVSYYKRRLREIIRQGASGKG